MSISCTPSREYPETVAAWSVSGPDGSGLVGAYVGATILDKINGKPRAPLPPKSMMGKWRVFALRAPSSLIWGGWGFAVPFYFVQDCLKASTGVTHSVMIAIMTRNLRSNASKLNAFKTNMVICQ